MFPRHRRNCMRKTVIQANSLDVLIAVKKKTDKMDKYLIHTHYITGTTFVRL